MQKEECRTERKKREVRERIIEAATGLFIEKGARSVSMDDVAQASDVARRTLFNYFESKDDLLFATASPVLSEAIVLVEEALAGPAPRLDDVIQLCVALWRRLGRRLGLIYAVGLEESPRLAELHSRYLGLLGALIQKAESRDPRLSGRARLVGKLVYRSFVPLLLALEGEEEAERRFADGLKGLVEGCCGEPDS